MVLYSPIKRSYNKYYLCEAYLVISFKNVSCEGFAMCL